MNHLCIGGDAEALHECSCGLGRNHNGVEHTRRKATNVLEQAVRDVIGIAYRRRFITLGQADDLYRAMGVTP